MTSAPLQTAARGSGDESSGQARDHASELAGRLTAQGLRASDEPHRGHPAGAVAVAAQRVDVHPHVGRVVVLLPGPHDPDELFWHWQRPLRGPHIGARWFQPFCRAGDVVTAAKAIAAAIDADIRARARLAHASSARPDAAEEPDGEVLVYVGHRVHSLVSRMLVQLKATEKDLEDPDLLSDLYGIDHLATQLRRAAERLAVLGGRTARRASAPMPISTVLRQAMAEVEAFQRVRLTLPDDDVEIPGHAGPDVIHILAELVENATRFSRPDATVRIATAQVSDGLGVEVRDEGGLVLSADRLAGLRRILAAPFQVSVREQVRRGQIGLLVAARLAARHGVRIELHPRASGMRALVLLPRTLLASPASAAEVPQGSFHHRTHTPADPPAPSPPHPARGAQSAGEQCMPTAPPPADSPAQLDGRPPLPRRTRTRPIPNETPQPPPDPAPASSSVGPPAAELMARFATGVRRGQAEQRHGPARNPENG